ncbi:MAG: pyruvate, phosphate dikinase [Lentisphaeria bacterium]|nr:pyruvate, phosphate dikinase [Lentisphaeria bacterium]NQZ68063.1 pyruvate, phosphate dikinase [Lentisphaeria bacterium]
MMSEKYVYYFGSGETEGNSELKPILGGKGAGLANMADIGLPVPPGFTITTIACKAYYDAGKVYPEGMKDQVFEKLAQLEKNRNMKLGDAENPLLVSVRSGAAISMPGMMETILNLGLTDISVKGLANKTGNPRFAYDSYRRFIQMFGSTAMGLSKDEFEGEFERHKHEKTGPRLGVAEGEEVADTDMNAEELEEVCVILKAKYKELSGSDFPQDPQEQLVLAIDAVFNSWMADKAVTYRKIEKFTDAEAIGTGVNIQAMVFGNTGDNSGSGVAFTRDPSTGENIFYGDYLFNAQGEDVVAGIRTPVKLEDLQAADPAAYGKLVEARELLEKHYTDMQDTEFTIQEGELFMLQTRRGKRTPVATFRIAVEMVNEGLITKEEAISRIVPEDIERLFYPEIDPSIPADERKAAYLTTGINAVPGAAAGQVYFSAAAAEEAKERGERVILVRKETSPEDVAGMAAAKGILTQTGGKTSHAAVVARGWAKCCIVGCDTLSLDYDAKEMRIKGLDTVIKEGDFITLDGSTGDVLAGDLSLIDPTMPEEFEVLMSWADEVREINVRTNADTPADAQKAIEMGAEGIGLCRTEHMFFESQERIDAIQEMILAEEEDVRIEALGKLLPFQRGDFEGLFKVMDGRPVTIRLIDPPLHEFVPHGEEAQRKLAETLSVSYESVKSRVESLFEFNPMLGHRGCRLAITYPEILDMQVRAIVEAACNVKKAGQEVNPEIMIPLVMHAKELQILGDRARKVAEKILSENGLTKEEVPYLIGTMIEIPRAALTADKVAEHAEFFSFGTNDLTQTCMGLSRDDAGRFLPDYVDERKAGVFADDPFQSLDQDGVGQLVEIGIAKGRSTKPNLKIGICGEHGGELESVKFCIRAGMNYVSCSPYRVPIARLAAAQAVIEAK